MEMDNHGYANGSEMTQMDDHEYDSDDEIIPAMVTAFAATITAIASWYHQRYIEKEPSRSQDDAYVQQLESSRIKLTQLDQELQRARAQGVLLGGGNHLGDQGLPVGINNLSSGISLTSTPLISLPQLGQVIANKNYDGVAADVWS
ncbi:hypothetical protein HHK36_004341 [Tetracentron sinense]|uniref:Uncharacterized protein n=1 Tax=Tetracentron sinense TaxID=13715 RepID=A0A835DTC9_TETSI|nr:hypothetical protein HHK36_004341 [Tetracentron sinense]